MKRWVLAAMSLTLLVSLVGIASCTEVSTTPVKEKGAMPCELTGGEKAKVIEIALHTPEVGEWLEKESEYEITLVWVATNYENPEPYEYSWMSIFGYDEIEKAAEVISEWTVVYPGVIIRFGEPTQFNIQVTVDLNTEKTVDVDTWPPRGEVAEVLEVEAAPAKAVYLPGDEVEIEFEFKNVSSEPVTVTPFPPVIGITPPVTVHWKEQIIRSFPPGSGKLKLQSGETAVYTLIWDQKDNSGQQVAPGYYKVNADIKSHVSEADGSKSIYGTSGRVTKLLIQFPQGAMEKNIEIKQTQTVTGLPFMWKREELSIDLTIMLERGELTAEGAKFCAFATSPNSPSAGYDHPQWSGSVWAQYTVDGVIKDAGLAGMRYLDDGIQLCWGDDTGLDPLPSDAKELTFVITKFGDWEGPWEFHIPLQ